MLKSESNTGDKPTPLNFVKPIPGYPDYFASESGNILSNKSGRMKILKMQVSSTMYLTCTMYRPAEEKGCKGHILVAQAWLPNPDNLPEVDHLNRNKQDNRVSNLEWVTSEENKRRARADPNFKKYVKAVVQTTLDGTFVARYDSIAKASETTNLDSSAITKVVKKRRLKTGNFFWFYANEYEEGVTKQRTHGLCKIVEQYTMKGKFIRLFESVGAAAESVGAIKANISNACAGRSKSCRDFIWKYAEPEEKEDKDAETKDWVVLLKYPIYRISIDGRIYTTWLGRMKMQTEPEGENKGYFTIQVVDNEGEHHKAYIHILVAMAYVPNPDNLPCVNHIDGNKSNNHASNLEWCTHQENSQHTHDTGLGSSIKETIQFDLEGKEIARHRSLKAAAKAANISTDSISKVCRGITKLGEAGGFKWKYASDEYSLETNPQDE